MADRDQVLRGRALKLVMHFGKVARLIEGEKQEIDVEDHAKLKELERAYSFAMGDLLQFMDDLIGGFR